MAHSLTQPEEFANNNGMFSINAVAPSPAAKMPKPRQPKPSIVDDMPGFDIKDAKDNEQLQLALKLIKKQQQMLQAKFGQPVGQLVNLYESSSEEEAQLLQQPRIRKVQRPFPPPPKKGKGKDNTNNTPLFDPHLGNLELPEFFTAHNIEWMADMPL